MWYNLRPAIPVVLALCTVLPFWGWWTESSFVRTQRAQMVTDQAMVNDLTRFKIGPSQVHGNGLMTTVDVPKGGIVGLHWFEVKPVPEQDGFVASYTLSFWPPTCTRLPGEEEAIANGLNGSAAPTQLLSEDTMLGCFPRAVNHECHASAELKVLDASSVMCSVTGNKHIGGDQAECVPDALHRYFSKNGPIRAVYLVALRDLQPGDEITYNYLTAPDYVSKEAHVIAGCENILIE